MPTPAHACLAPIGARAAAAAIGATAVPAASTTAVPAAASASAAAVPTAASAAKRAATAQTATATAAATGRPTATGGSTGAAAAAAGSTASAATRSTAAALAAADATAAAVSPSQPAAELDSNIRVSSPVRDCFGWRRRRTGGDLLHWIRVHPGEKHFTHHHHFSHFLYRHSSHTPPTLVSRSFSLLACFTYTSIYTHTRARAHTHTHARTHAHARTRARTHTHTRTHVHTHTHARTYTHTHNTLKAYFSRHPQVYCPGRLRIQRITSRHDNDRSMILRFHRRRAPKGAPSVSGEWARRYICIYIYIRTPSPLHHPQTPIPTSPTSPLLTLCVWGEGSEVLKKLPPPFPPPFKLLAPSPLLAPSDPSPPLLPLSSPRAAVGSQRRSWWAKHLDEVSHRLQMALSFRF